MPENLSYRPEKNNSIEEKLGMSVEDLYNLVLLKSAGTEFDLLRLMKQEARGTTKKILRLSHVPEEHVRSITPNSQSRFINSITQRLSKEEKENVLQELVEKERKRVIEAITEIMADSQRNNLQNIRVVYLYGSLASKTDWPNDIDLAVVTDGDKDWDKISIPSLRRNLEEKTNKRTDIKKVKTSDYNINKDEEANKPERPPILVWSKNK